MKVLIVSRQGSANGTGQLADFGDQGGLGVRSEPAFGASPTVFSAEFRVQSVFSADFRIRESGGGKVMGVRRRGMDATPLELMDSADRAQGSSFLATLG
jgi:hypothetical protein